MEERYKKLAQVADDRNTWWEVELPPIRSSSKKLQGPPTEISDVNKTNAKTYSSSMPLD